MEILHKQLFTHNQLPFLADRYNISYLGIILHDENTALKEEKLLRIIIKCNVLSLL